MNTKKRYHHQPHELTQDYFLKVYVSFDDWKYIPKEDFEWIEEWHADAERKYLVGVLHVSKLTDSSWWKENNTSLILSTDPIIDNLDIIKLKKEKSGAGRNCLIRNLKKRFPFLSFDL